MGAPKKRTFLKEIQRLQTERGDLIRRIEELEDRVDYLSNEVQWIVENFPQSTGIE